MNALRPFLFVAVLLAVLAPLRSPAPLYQDGCIDTDAKELAANYSHSVGSLSLTVPQGVFVVSGVFPHPAAMNLRHYPVTVVAFSARDVLENHQWQHCLVTGRRISIN